MIYRIPIYVKGKFKENTVILLIAEWKESSADGMKKLVWKEKEWYTVLVKCRRALERTEEQERAA